MLGFSLSLKAGELMLRGAAGLWIFWFGYLHRISCKGNAIRCRKPFGKDDYFRFSEVVIVDGNADRSEYKLLFANGRKLRANTYFHGFNEFMEELDKRFVDGSGTVE